MYSKPFALFTFAALSLVSANPTVDRRAGIRIPLQKRSNITNDDGTANVDIAIAQTVRSINKHRQNLINLQQNVGNDSFNEVRIPRSICPYYSHILVHYFRAPRSRPLPHSHPPVFRNGVLPWPSPQVAMRGQEQSISGTLLNHSWFKLTVRSNTHI